MAETKRIALLGAGLIGRRHVDYVRAFAVVSGIVDPTDEARRFAAEAGFPWFATLDALLKDHRPDGVIHATPNHLHVDLGLQCVAEGLPSLIEKPIADKAESAARLVAAADAAGVPLLIGHHRRHNALIATAKRALDNGLIGDLVAVQAQFWLYKPDDYFDATWRQKAGAGPTFINMIHDLDLLRHLCGEVVEVQAMESRKQRGFEVEDTSVVLLRFENGALGTVSISDTVVAPWSWEFSARENPAYDHVPTHSYALGGTQGSLSVPDLKVWTHPGARSWWEPIGSETLAFEPNDPLHTQMAHFIDVIEGKADPLVSGAEGLKTLQLVEAIKWSAETGQRWIAEA